MKILRPLFIAAAVALICSCDYDHVASGIRPSAYPLITIDPYTSAWAVTDNLYDANIQHWTGTEFPMEGNLIVDGQPYRFMGTSIKLTQIIIPTGEIEEWPCMYTTLQPSGKWMAPDYSTDAQWRAGKGSFGCLEPDTSYRSEWTTSHIWIRREFDLDESYEGREVFLELSHDDDVTVWINGCEVVDRVNTFKCNDRILLPEEITSTLKAGKNVICATCWNRSGDGVIDFGLSCTPLSDGPRPLTAVQQSVDVQATSTHYTFTCGPVDLKLSFTAPLLLDNLDLVSRPVNYISYQVTSNDNAVHEVDITFDASAAWAVDREYQMQNAELSMANDEDLVYLWAGTDTQDILGKKGDSVRIDWGYFFLAAEKDGTAAIAEDGILHMRRNLGKVQKGSSGKIMVGYDDCYSIQYFGENLRPYWNRTGDKTIQDQFSLANKEYDRIMKACERFDSKLMADATYAGGRKYAELCALAYRQAIAAHKLVEAPNGDILWLSKECNSNGSIGTVDVTYPSAPLFLLYNPELAKGLLNHIYYYSESGKWTKPFPAHDVGTYPIANGQTYGGDMPVEEAGNAITLTAAICYYQKDFEYARKHWDTLTTWADYLKQFGLDPEDQLCTDDFAGRSAHNTNLSIKAIVALASYGMMAEELGHADIAEQYTATAKEMAAQWVEMADAGDHYGRTFDNPQSWSQKYNLVWDKLLGLDIFPEEVAEKEIAFYPSVENIYGLPLDERSAYTKTDWIIWTATLADSREDFMHLVDAVYKFQCETTDRVAMSDWVWTDKTNHVGFKARSVVGGYFIKMLDK